MSSSYTTYGTGRDNTLLAIAARHPFATNGALRGDTYAGSFGMLSPVERAAWPNDVDYVVSSYATPIAWHSGTYGWHVVDQRFSATTSRHQSIVRLALDDDYMRARAAVLRPRSASAAYPSIERTRAGVAHVLERV